MNDIEILEQLLVDKGRIVTHSDLKKYYSVYKNINNKINLLAKKGWLISLKKGQYCIAKLGSLGYASASSFLIANIISNKDSFVSFEAALQYYNLFDQSLRKVRSISCKQYQEKTLENITYQYVTVKNKNYFGYTEATIDGEKVLIATKERSLLDLIEHQRTVSSISLVLEKLKNYQEEFNLKLVVKYLKEYSQVTIKTIGLLFDSLGIDTKEVASLIENASSTSRLLSTSATFSSKWRLYYDSIILNS